jgi:hemoglobin
MADTIYNLIGGRMRINSAVDLFYKQVLADPSLGHFFKNTDMNHLRSLQSMFVSMLLGGRIVYTGKDIRKAHAAPRAMGMTDAHFDALLAHFRSALEEVGVQGEALEKVMAQLETTRSAVLGREEA